MGKHYEIYWSTCLNINVFRIVFDHYPMGLFSDITAILNPDVSNSYCGVLRGANLYVFAF